MSSVSYQKTYLRYLEHSIDFLTDTDLQKLSENSLDALN